MHWVGSQAGAPEMCTAQPPPDPGSFPQAVLGDALGSQLCQHIVQVVRVRVAVAAQVRVHLGFVVDLIPHHCVALAGGAGGAHCEDQASLPGHLQELQDLDGEGKKKEKKTNQDCPSAAKATKAACQKLNSLNPCP